jgi:HSP20 family protein
MEVVISVTPRYLTIIGDRTMRNLKFPARRRAFSSLANRLVDDMWTDFNSLISNDAASWITDSMSTYPKVNLIDSDSESVIEASVPGLTNDQVKVEYSNGMLTVAGESVNETEGKDASYIFRELHKRAFSRTFPVSEDIYDVDKIEAKVENGMLRVVVPKKEPENNKKEIKKIEVK